MKGLIKKDLFLIRSNLKTIFILVVMLLFMLMNGTSVFTFILPFICVMICITTFNYDDYNHWDAYAATLPNGRKNVVKSKYVFTILLIVCSCIITLFIFALFTVFKIKAPIDNILFNVIGQMFATLLVMSIMYPVLYKFGTEKGRIYIFIFVFVFSFGIGLITLLLNKLNMNFQSITSFFNQFGAILMPIIILLLLYVSFKLSEKIYLKKEF